MRFVFYARYMRDLGEAMKVAGVPRVIGNSPSQDFLRAWRRLEMVRFLRDGDQRRLARFRRLFQFVRANRAVVEYYEDTAETMAYLTIETNWLGLRAIIVAEDTMAVPIRIRCLARARCLRLYLFRLSGQTSRLL